MLRRHSQPKNCSCRIYHYLKEENEPLTLSKGKLSKLFFCTLKSGKLQSRSFGNMIVFVFHGFQRTIAWLNDANLYLKSMTDTTGLHRTRN